MFRRHALLIALLLAGAACKPAPAAPTPPPPSPPPVSAETAAMLAKMDRDGGSLHRRLRDAAGLTTDLKGDAVVRIATAAFMDQTSQSLTATRTPDGWRIERVSRRDIGIQGPPPKPVMTVVQVPAADGARIDALLASPEFYAQETWRPHPSCFDGETTILSVVSPAGRWKGAQVCTLEGPADGLANLLFSLAPLDVTAPARS